MRYDSYFPCFIVENFCFSRKKGAISLYQAAARLLPRLANAYKLALAKSAYSRFSFCEDMGTVLLCEDMGTVLLSYRATHKRTGLLPAASLPDWRIGMPAAKAFRIDASHRVPLQRPASCRLSLPDGSEANLPHETVKSLRRQDKRTVPSSPPVSQKLSG